jgi:NADPH2:quinone reductase
MRAVICSSFGPPESLELREVPRPEPGDGEVRVAVEACGVNFPDTLIIEGKYQFRPDPPFSPGGEVAGRVSALGKNVNGLSEGDPVIAVNGYGGFAEEAIVTPDRLMKRPEHLDPVVAAGFSITYGTAIHALVQRAAIKPGETLLVLGAGGGVGLAAVEIGKLLGARVIAAASSDEKLAAAREQGAEETINYASESLRDRVKELTGGRGVDVAFDPVGGDFLEQAVRASAWGGRVLVIGFASGTIPKVPANLLLLKGASLVGVFWGTFRQKEPEAEAANFRRLFAWHAEGKLRPRVSVVLPLEDAPAALRSLLDRTAIGKIVLTTKQGAT